MPGATFLCYPRSLCLRLRHAKTQLFHVLPHTLSLGLQLFQVRLQLRDQLGPTSEAPLEAETSSLALTVTIITVVAPTGAVVMESVVLLLMMAVMSATPALLFPFFLAVATAAAIVLVAPVVVVAPTAALPVVMMGSAHGASSTSRTQSNQVSGHLLK
jgi:hypothetical protein